MNYSVSYNKVWGKDGTTYDQTIKIKCTCQKLAWLNTRIICDSLFIDPRMGIYLHELKEDVNYTTHILLMSAATNLGIITNKRVKTNRNTRIIIVITNKNKIRL